MPLLGRAAMVLQFDVEPAAIADHDDWHTHEHLPERLAIPGFLRGTRWIAAGGGPRYLVVYEVADLATLTSEAYLARLDAPSAWTTRVMPHYRGMRRGFCTVAASAGFGAGHAARLWRFATDAPGQAAWRRRWVDEVLPAWVATPGIGGAHLLEGADTPRMTREQSLRGADAGVDGLLLATGYRAEALRRLDAGLDEHDAGGTVASMYDFDYALSAAEVAASR